MRKEQVSILNMGRMSYILCNSLSTLKAGLEDMSETLMQVLNAHVLSPDHKSFIKMILHMQKTYVDA